jgi:hypothetical protein
LGVGESVATDEVIVVGRDEETDEEEREDVEEGDTPEDLLASRGQGLQG